MLKLIPARSLGAFGLLAAALPATAVAGVSIAPSAVAAGTCSGTIAVTDEATNSVLGSLATPGGLYAAFGYTGYTSDESAATTYTLGEDADGYFTISTSAGELGPVPGSVAYGTDFSADRADYALLADQNTVGSTHLWSLDDLSLTASWPNSDDSRTPLHIYDDSSSDSSSRNQYVGIASNLDKMAETFTGESFPEIAFTVVPDDGADCGQTPPDTTKPVTTITGGPADGATVTQAPEYTFEADEAATFECAIDDGSFSTCTSPYDVDVTDLPDGDHTFRVRATDLADNLGDAVSRDFTLDAVDTDAPSTTIDSGPADGDSVETSPTFTFSSTADDVDHFECSTDGTTYATCTSPYATDLAPGTYTFSVRAVDEANNVGDPVTRTFTVRDVACENATTAFYAAKDDVRAAKDKLAAARESGNPKRIERSKERLAGAKADKNDAKADVIEECGSVIPPRS